MNKEVTLIQIGGEKLTENWGGGTLRKKIRDLSGGEVRIGGASQHFGTPNREKN